MTCIEKLRKLHRDWHLHDGTHFSTSLFGAFHYIFSGAIYFQKTSVNIYSNVTGLPIPHSQRRSPWRLLLDMASFLVTIGRYGYLTQFRILSGLGGWREKLHWYINWQSKPLLVIYLFNTVYLCVSCGNATDLIYPAPWRIHFTSTGKYLELRVRQAGKWVS